MTARCNPRFGEDALNCGNYLLGALANRWVHSLTYVYPTAPPRPEPEPPEDPRVARMEKIRRFLNPEIGHEEPPPVRDVPHALLRNGDLKTGEIQLKGYKAEEYMKSNPLPFCVEPPVPLKLAAGGEFRFSGFRHIVLARSPQYTPRRADGLLPVIREYFAAA